MSIKKNWELDCLKLHNFRKPRDKLKLKRFINSIYNLNWKKNQD